jgi:AraC-like DNA-binding protein
MSALSVSQVYVSLFSNYLEQLQTKRPDLQCHRIGLPVATNESNDCVPLALLEDFISSIVRTTNIESLGLDIGEHTHPSDYGIFGYAVMNCATLSQAIKLVQSHVMLLNQAFTVTLRECKDEVFFELESNSCEEVGRILVELQFASACKMANFLAGHQQKPDIYMTEVRFKHSPLTDYSRYLDVFNCPVLFNQEKNEIVIANVTLSKEVRSASPKILSMLMKKMQRLHDEMNNNVSLGQRVCEFLENNVGHHGIPNAQVVAQNFNMSLSTLKKHLHQENLNYTVICDDVRRNIAIKKVVYSTDQLQIISSGLGFSNTSAFNRAFRRWTKVTPAEYRRAHT